MGVGDLLTEGQAVFPQPPPDVGDNQWNLGDLPGGASGTVSVTGAVGADLPDGTVLANTVDLGVRAEPRPFRAGGQLCPRLLG